MDFDKNFLNSTDYNFLREDERLGKNISYLTISGSIAYGTNIATSDIDVRGFAVESMNTILTGKNFEQVEDLKTDTVIYGLRKFFKICAACNPNAIEMLGTKPEHILYIDDIGRKVRDNVENFLSKRAYATFVGYATAQLRRLQNALARDSYPQIEKERHILKSIQSMMLACKKEYALKNSSIDFELLDSPREDFDKEIFITVKSERVPLRNFLAMNHGLTTLLNNYAKLNHRNRKKDENHLHKHAMHLIRLYLMGIDILSGRGINTYREGNLPLLKKIRAGEIPLDDVFKMADEYEEKILDAYKNSTLPDYPDESKIEKLLIEIYTKTCR
mgnify:CR=1 FL=1